MRDLLKWLKDFLNNPYLVLFLTLVFFAVIYLDKLVLFIQYQLPDSSISGLATINDRIMLATFFGLIWYANETRKMSKATEILSKLESPAVEIFYHQNEKRFEVLNTGRGVAYNLSIETDFKCDDGRRFIFEKEDEYNMFLLPGDKKEVRVSLERGNESSQISDFEQFKSYLKGKNLKSKLQLNYIDHLGSPHKRVFEIEGFNSNIKLIQKL